MKTSRRQQPQRIPPPITYGEDALDAGIVLEELSGDLALALWKTVRTVYLWAALPPDERGEAFAPEAFGRRMEVLRQEAVPPEIRPALEAAARVLDPSTASPEEASGACREVAEWAKARGATGTALEFLQAAALALPLDASLAHAVARLARRRAEFARAETWYRQAIFLARRTRDRDSLARSYCGLGTTFMHRGAYPAARQALLRGLRAAQRYSLHDLATAISHDLAVVAIRTDRGADVVKHARAALEGYGSAHPRLPALAHDVAVFWMNRGYFAAVLPVFQAIPDGFGDAGDRLTLAASTARAAGGVGDRALHAERWDEALALLEDAGAAERSATALVELARGAEALGEWEKAESAAGRAFELARSRAEGEKALEAESVLESIRRSRSAGTPRVRPVRAPRQVQWLAREMAARLPEGAAIG